MVDSPLFPISVSEFSPKTETIISKKVTQLSAHDAPTKSRHRGGLLKQLQITFCALQHNCFLIGHITSTVDILFFS